MDQGMAEIQVDTVPCTYLYAPAGLLAFRTHATSLFPTRPYCSLKHIHLVYYNSACGDTPSLCEGAPALCNRNNPSDIIAQ